MSEAMDEKSERFPHDDPMTLGWLAWALDGCLESEALTRLSAQRRWRAVETDSRAPMAGAVFVALKGERFDGRDFAAKAAAEGAAALVLERPISAEAADDAVQFVVSDARLAYGRIAKAWRARYSLPLTAVGGSNGKTTTTQMLASILRARWGAERMLATEGNFNNDVGVPKTLLRLRFEHRAAVVEAGMNHKGEMARLADWIRPTIALLTNAQREHQEFLSSVEETARENGLLIPALPESGIAVYPADDACGAPIWAALSLARGVRTLAFAMGPSAEGLPPADLLGEALPDGGLRIHGSALGAPVDFTVKLSIPGAHNARNALAAAAAALAQGIGPEAIREGLEAFRALPGRGERWRSAEGPEGVEVIDDAYNANPDSCEASIRMLAAAPGRKVLILGDMAEVGADALERHREIGAFAKAEGVDLLWTAGALAAHAAEAFGEGARAFASREELLAALPELELPAGALVDVKASHSAGFSAVVEALKRQLSQTTE